MTFQKVLAKYRKISFSERDKGDRFERLMQAYLQTDPKYAFLFKKVWLWNEFPGKNDLGGGDTGIDLVSLTHDGDYWAVQCKCFQEGTVIDKPAIDSFLSTSSRKFKNDNSKSVGFACIDSEVTIIRTVGNQRIEQHFKKYQVISCHTARKTWVSLSMERGLGIEYLTSVTGHQNPKVLRASYLGLSEKTRREAITSAWGDMAKQPIDK